MHLLLGTASHSQAAEEIMSEPTIVAAWAEPARGPGWSNWPVWYLERAFDSTLTIKCLQPDEQSGEVLTLYNLCAEAHKALIGAVDRALRLKREGAAKGASKK